MQSFVQIRKMGICLLGIVVLFGLCSDMCIAQEKVRGDQKYIETMQKREQEQARNKKRVDRRVCGRRFGGDTRR